MVIEERKNKKAGLKTNMRKTKVMFNIQIIGQTIRVGNEIF